MEPLWTIFWWRYGPVQSSPWISAACSLLPLTTKDSPRAKLKQCCFILCIYKPQPFGNQFGNLWVNSKTPPVLECSLLLPWLATRTSPISYQVTPCVRLIATKLACEDLSSSWSTHAKAFAGTVSWKMATCSGKNICNCWFLPPKSSILIGFGTIVNHPFWGTPIFGNTHILLYWYWYSENKNPLSFVCLCISIFTFLKESFAEKIWIGGQNLRSVPVFFPSFKPCETPSAANCIHRWSARHHPLPRFRRRCCSGDDTNGKQSIPWHCCWGSKPFLLPTKRRLSFLGISWL